MIMIDENEIIEQKYKCNNLEKIVEYYRLSDLEIPKGLDLKSSTYDSFTRMFHKQINNFSDSSGLIDSLLLKDASQYLNKSFYVLLCYKNLQTSGYYSWSEVTKYYVRFYLNITLDRIQGHALFHGEGPKLELLRLNWDSREYEVRKAKLKGRKFHGYIWDITKEYYKDLKINKNLSTNERDIKMLFDDDNSKQFIGISDMPIRREDLETRDEYTYAALGFDELYFAKDVWSPVEIVKSEGKKNFIDNTVFAKETSVEDYDGTGIDENQLGIFIKFTMELMGQISNGISGKYNPIYFKKSLFEKLKTNDDTLNTLSSWAEKCNLQIT
jgi:hypothetical protein